MRCPFCGNLEDKVTDSRSLASGSAVRRRRECLSCGARFTSYERIEERPVMVIKRDGRREPFDRTKIERGLERAIQKRPVSPMEIDRLVNEVEDEVAIVAGVEREASTKTIGEMVLARLGALDKVAYIRFASVCRHFENLEEFVEEIKRLGEKHD
ncbi:MAG: transcriptional regulator NrdR [Spirochaetaceae bacterium]|jgi:transcriptional repressor NrdR|nr:transcriptional regulator NrdR [Spirochaetaceae bacterium]GMO30122.1 MAG: transcriptional regulator NrdR [Termitinemataceae bacterium]